MTQYWYVMDVNPEPWVVGPINVIRKGGHFIPKVGQDVQLADYQKAIKQFLEDQNPVMVEGKVRLTFLFWRQQTAYQTQRGRRHRRHEADLTNMIKATEDALQGVVIGNDRDTREVAGYIIQQGPDVRGRVIVCVEPAGMPYILREVPDEIWDRATTMIFEGSTATESDEEEEKRQEDVKGIF